ncbi:hypothetical protein D3C76_1086180 [compost metagenome]
MPHRQRAGHRVIKAVGPARIGDVPEGIFRTQVDRIAQVAGERQDGLQRHRQRLGQPGGAGGEHQHERIVAAAQHRLEVWRMALQFGPEAVVAVADALPLRPANGNGQRRIFHFVELVAVGAVGD